MFDWYMKKQNYQNNWDELADIDTKWAILTDNKNKYWKWENKEFFESGREQVRCLFQLLRDLNITIEFNNALDFGCGIGRVTIALSEYFNKVYGIDISKKMIFKAKTYSDKDNIIFHHNTNDNLSFLNSSQFNLVYSIITLQHIPDKNTIKFYLKEFIRLLKPGGLLFFQLPTIPAYNRFKNLAYKFRGSLYYLLVYKLKIPKKYCYSYLRIGHICT